MYFSRCAKAEADSSLQLFQKFEQESAFQTLAAQASAALKSKELGSGKHYSRNAGVQDWFQHVDNDELGIWTLYGMHRLLAAKNSELPIQTPHHSVTSCGQRQPAELWEPIKPIKAG